jgi:hypothetical protein
LIPAVPRPRTLANTRPSGDALVFADHFACYRVPSLPRVVSVCVGAKSISNDMNLPKSSHDQLLPSPNGGTFPSIWTYSSHSKGVLLAMVHPSSNRIVCQLMFISHSNKLGFYLTRSLRKSTRRRNNYNTLLSQPHADSKAQLPPLKPTHPRSRPRTHKRVPRFLP